MFKMWLKHNNTIVDLILDFINSQPLISICFKETHQPNCKTLSMHTKDVTH